MTQNAGVAIDECDFTDTGSGVVEGGVIAHHAEFFRVHLDLAEVGSADGAVGNRKFVGLPGAVVGDGQSLTGRDGAFRFFRLRRGQWGVHLSVPLRRSKKTNAALQYHCTPKGAAPETGRKGGQSPQTETVMGAAGAPGRRFNVPLDNCRYNEYYAFVKTRRWAMIDIRKSSERG